MKQDWAQNLIEAGMGTEGSVIQSSIRCASSKWDGEEIFMLACGAADREMAKSFLKKVKQIEAVLNSQGYTTILQARIPGGGPMDTFRPNGCRKDDCIDISRTRSGQWQFNGRDASGDESVAAYYSVRPNRANPTERWIRSLNPQRVSSRFQLLEVQKEGEDLFSSTRGLPAPTLHDTEGRYDSGVISHSNPFTIITGVSNVF